MRDTTNDPDGVSAGAAAGSGPAPVTPGSNAQAPKPAGSGSDPKRSDPKPSDKESKPSAAPKRKKKRTRKNKPKNDEPTDEPSANGAGNQKPQLKVEVPATSSSTARAHNKEQPEAPAPEAAGAPKEPPISKPGKVPMSPRKQAIMRYKKSDENINSRSYINEVRDNLKSKTAPDDEVQVFDEKVDLDERVTLFKYKTSKIFVYDEQLTDGKAHTSSSGRLLGHGEFEIFQLHNGDVTYLSCGTSFIYPLLPKLKILRINFNQFILPLVNPERYWKIFINSDEPNVIQVLENTLERIVQYRNLFFGSPPQKKSPITGLENVPENQILPGLLPSGYETNPSDVHAINEQPSELKSLSIIDETESNGGNPTMEFEFSRLAGDIPDSPPSAPISPPHHNGYADQFSLSASKNANQRLGWSLNKKSSNQSISTSMACLDLAQNTPKKPTIHKNVLHQPRPGRYHEPMSKPVFNENYKAVSPSKVPYQMPSHYQGGQRKLKQDEKSDSSMDSLLDEYEENIIHTKSNHPSRQPSRPPSRGHSVISAPQFPHRAPHYSRDSFSRDAIDREARSTQFDDFPSTSLSEYNKTHNQTRSRRSSRSDLYVSESNWMEPTMPADGKPRLPKSRSSYSMNNAGAQNLDLNNTYRNIYRSITQRNLNQFVDDDVRSTQSYQSPRQAYPVHSRGDFGRSAPRDRDRNDAFDMKLDSSEVYKIISRGKPKSRKSIAERFFGWG